MATIPEKMYAKYLDECAKTEIEKYEEEHGKLSKREYTRMYDKIRKTIVETAPYPEKHKGEVPLRVVMKNEKEHSLKKGHSEILEYIYNIQYETIKDWIKGRHWGTCLDNIEYFELNPQYHHVYMVYENGPFALYNFKARCFSDLYGKKGMLGTYDQLLYYKETNMDDCIHYILYVIFDELLRKEPKEPSARFWFEILKEMAWKRLKNKPCFRAHYTSSELLSFNEGKWDTSSTVKELVANNECTVRRFSERLSHHIDVIINTSKIFEYKLVKFGMGIEVKDDVLWKAKYLGIITEES